MTWKTPEEIALERIDEASQALSTSLDLRFLGLSNLPSRIGQLTNLVSLDLSSNELISVSEEILKLKKLRFLKLSSNLITSLSPDIARLVELESFDCAGNLITSIPSEFWQLKKLKVLVLLSNELITLSPEIGQLTNLEILSLGNNKLTSIPDEIAFLTKLKFLDLTNNQLTFLPSGIGNLSDLNILRLRGNLFSTSIPRIWHLTQLTSLDLSNNQIKTLPPEIGQLTQLTSLDLSNNQLTDLPAEVGSLQRLELLGLHKNPLKIPPEILKKIGQPDVVLSYFGQRTRKSINQLKMLIVGQGSVGKTSLIQQVLYNIFDEHQNKTEGISITKWRVGSRRDQKSETQIQINIWDFGGQEIMHSTHQFFLTRRSLYLLVLDSRLTQEENRVEYWLKIIQSFGGESPVLIVGNKIDQHPLDIDRTGLQKKYPNIIGVLKTSAATGAGIEALKAAIMEQVNNLPHVRDLLPETWFTVKTKLEELERESEANFISYDDYVRLCAENEVGDETSQRTLIGFLHDLGVVLHFQDDPRLEALGILNPQWVTNGVYKILNSHTLFQNKGVLTVSMLDEILNLPEYPRGKRLFIVDMMKKFELCYDIEADKTFLVPDLLPKEQPELNFNGIPAFEYAYPVLPSSVITRFIVRMNQKIDDGLVWRTGVVLKIGDNKALVKADIEDRKITIAIDGLEHTRRDALSAIRYHLDEIHTSIKGLDAQKRVPIPGAPNAEPLEYEYLLMLEREGDETCRVKDGSRLVTVNVRQVLSAIESEAQRKGRGGNVTNIYVGGNVDGNMIIGDENVSSTS